MSSTRTLQQLVGTSNAIPRRVADIVFASAVVLLILNGLILPVAVLMKLESKRLVFYKQLHIGKNGQPFCFLPRSMCLEVEADSKQVSWGITGLTQVSGYHGETKEVGVMAQRVRTDIHS